MTAGALNPRFVALVAVAAICAVLAFSGDDQTPTPVAAVSRASIGPAGGTDAARRDASKRAAAKSATLTSLPLDKLERAQPSAAKGDLFAAAGWNAPPKIDLAKRPPPPPPEAALPPPKPRPPALPFQFFGHMMDGDTATVFLTQAGRNHVVKSGETIDGAYRVESITPQKIVFRYLPLDETQELARGTP